MVFTHCVRSIGEKWRCLDDSKFVVFKNNCINNSTSGYQTVYDYIDKNRDRPVFDHFFLDFDDDSGVHVEDAISEALSIGGLLAESFDFSSIVIIRSGGKGAHLIAYFDVIKGDSLDSKFCNEIHSVFFDFIKSVFSPIYLCDSCREPVKRLRRIPGTVHEKTGVLCTIVREFIGRGDRSCVNMCLNRLYDDIINKPLKLNLNVSCVDDSIDFSSIDLREVFKSLRPDIVVSCKGDGNLLIVHPLHPVTGHVHNGICFSTHSYCFSELLSVNFFDTVKLLLNTDSNAVVMKYLYDNWKV
jgi:hypothetical protein